MNTVKNDTANAIGPIAASMNFLFVLGIWLDLTSVDLSGGIRFLVIALVCNPTMLGIVLYWLLYRELLEQVRCGQALSGALPGSKDLKLQITKVW